MFKSYFKQPDETQATMTADGWLKTGDAGYLDDKGRLVVVDRLRDIATTATKVRFSPSSSRTSSSSRPTSANAWCSATAGRR